MIMINVTQAMLRPFLDKNVEDPGVYWDSESRAFVIANYFAMITWCPPSNILRNTPSQMIPVKCFPVRRQNAYFDHFPSETTEKPTDETEDYKNWFELLVGVKGFTKQQGVRINSELLAAFVNFDKSSGGKGVDIKFMNHRNSPLPFIGVFPVDQLDPVTRDWTGIMLPHEKYNSANYYKLY